MKKVKGMLDIIDADLIARVKKERQKNFINELDAGKQLGFGTIKALGTMLKGDYIKWIKKDDDNVMHYIESQVNRNEEIHDGVVKYIYGMEDQQALWTDAVDRIDDMAVRCA